MTKKKLRLKLHSLQLGTIFSKLHGTLHSNPTIVPLTDHEVPPNTWNDPATKHPFYPLR